MTRRPDRRGGIRVDPAIQRLMDDAASNRATRTPRQLRDAERVRLRLDVPSAVKTRLAARAAEYHVSMSNLGAALLWYALLSSDDPTHPIHAALDAASTIARSLRHECAIDLAKFAEALPCTEDSTASGPSAGPSAGPAAGPPRGQ